jgi:Activator of Hsp90 ATPase homolog 1-like protein
MKKQSDNNKRPRMSDAAVKAKTGKVWKEWFEILDEAGAKKMPHKEIAKYLSTEQGVDPWWSQMVSVTYEQQRGLRDVHEKPEGYEVGVSRTVNASLSKLYLAVANQKRRATWLDEHGLVVRTATPNKTIRLTWIDKKSSVEIYFNARGDQKSQVVVQHRKLPDAKAAARMKTYWSKALDRLRQSL